MIVFSVFARAVLGSSPEEVLAFDAAPRLARELEGFRVGGMLLEDGDLHLAGVETADVEEGLLELASKGGVFALVTSAHKRLFVEVRSFRWVGPDLVLSLGATLEDRIEG